MRSFWDFHYASSLRASPILGIDSSYFSQLEASAQQDILIPPVPPLSADAAMELIKKTGAQSAVLAPSTLDDIGKTPHLLDALGGLNCVMGDGDAFAKTAGNTIITKTRLLNVLGTTEIGTSHSSKLHQKIGATLVQALLLE